MSDTSQTRAQLGLGLAAIGRPAYMTLGHHDDVPDAGLDAMSRHAVAMCQAAYEAGLRHFDTARSYGRGERFLRDWLDAKGPEGVVVSSKWGYRYVGEWKREAPVHEVKDLSLAHLDRQWPESLSVLGRWLTVYQLHSVTLESGVLDDEAVLGRMAFLRAEKGLALGLSVTGPRQPAIIEKALSIRRDGVRLFDWVQATWNVLEPSAGPALQAAANEGVKVIVKEPLGNGRLSPRGDAAFGAVAAKYGTTADALALACALAQPWASVVLVGATTLEQLRSNLKARELTAPDLSSLRETPEIYWEKRSRLRWT